MGRKRRTVASGALQARVERRLGMDATICTDCEARNPADAERCRKCGHGELRPRADQFRDE